jgi:glycosyltransferase involved in cell wall biosynthesis
MPFKLQCLTVSVNYSDFILHTLPANKALFDRWVVVTDTKDLRTKELCDEHGVLCIQTDVFYEGGAFFNKYAGINEGLKYIDDDAWVLFLDSDIVLHHEMRRTLISLKLDPTCLYGVDRLNIQGVKMWEEYKAGPSMLKHNWMLTTGGLELGARLVHLYGHEGENGRFEGWRPLGFFQLAHRSAFIDYPQQAKGADHEDLEFARLWHRSKRVFIPELFAIHLESERTHKGVNWYGRKSEPFVAKELPGGPPPNAPVVAPESPRLPRRTFFTKVLDLLKTLWQAIVKYFSLKKPEPPYYSTK